MATTFGTEDRITDLILLERNAIAADNSAILWLPGPALSQQVDGFRRDHLQHRDVLNQITTETRVMPHPKAT